ncbi:uncharacterized protein [Amphiura filiformis]|uniref:uncharacterized protein n=1 Tax=Amphiura filiformis TaxID=82378 RepID=UPI003B21B066
MRPFMYGRESLYSLRKTVIKNKSCRIKQPVWDLLKELKIAKQTRRGCRAGKGKQRSIPVCINNRPVKRFQSEQYRPKELVTIKLETGAQISTSKPVLKSRIATWNGQSVIEKAADVCDFILNEKLDILAITEAWWKGDERDHTFLADITNTLPDHQIHYLPRSGKSGGGICVILRKGYGVKTTPHKYSSFECLELSISNGLKDVVNLIVIYRSGSANLTKQFFSDFSCLLESTAGASEHLIITGDFNIHMDVPDDLGTRTMNDILQSAGLTQHVTEPTHIKGHMLDLLITRDLHYDYVFNTYVQWGLPSDHAAVISDVMISRPETSKRVIKSRKLREINMETLRKEVSDCLDLDQSSDVNAMVLSYDSTLRALIDAHAPEKTREVSLRPKAPWYTESLRRAKTEKRQAERKWLKSRLTVDKEIHREKCRQYKNDLHSAKRDYYCDQISGCDTKQMFRLVNRLSVYKPPNALPSHTSKKDLANTFCKFFDEKIKKSVLHWTWLLHLLFQSILAISVIVRAI